MEPFVVPTLACACGLPAVEVAGHHPAESYSELWSVPDAIGCRQKHLDPSGPLRAAFSARDLRGDVCGVCRMSSSMLRKDACSAELGDRGRNESGGEDGLGRGAGSGASSDIRGVLPVVAAHRGGGDASIGAFL